MNLKLKEFIEFIVKKAFPNSYFYPHTEILTDISYSVRFSTKSQGIEYIILLECNILMMARSIFNIKEHNRVDISNPNIDPIEWVAQWEKYNGMH